MFQAGRVAKTLNAPSGGALAGLFMGPQSATGDNRGFVLIEAIHFQSHNN